MSNLSRELQEILDGAKLRIPAESLETMVQATQDLKATGIEGKALGQGDKAPDFTLQSHRGEQRTLSAMLRNGPLVISFYRGGW